MEKLRFYLRSYKKEVILSSVCHVVTAIFTVFSIPIIIPFFQILFQRDIESMVRPEHLFDVAEWIKFYSSNLILNNTKETALLYICALIVVVFFLKNLFRYLSSFFMIPVRNGLIRDLRAGLYKQYLSLPYAFLDKQKRGDLLSRISTDAVEIEWSILSYIEVVFKSPFIIIGSMIFMLYISVSLTLFVLVLLAFTILIIGFVSRKLKQDSGEVQAGMANVVSITEQSLSGVEVIKAYNAQDYMESKFQRENDHIFTSLTRLLRRRDLSSPLSEFLGVSVVAVLLWFGSSLVFKGSLLPETFFAFIFAFYQVIEPSKSFSTAFYNIKKGMAAVDRINNVMHEEKENERKLAQKNLFTNWKKILIDRLSFSYNSQQKILKDITVDIDHGDSVAIVGSSGSGKTTLVKLIQRHYETYNGDITIDGVDVRSTDLAVYRASIAIVTQDSILFNDSIRNNILMGRVYVNDRYKQVLSAALLSDKIKSLKDGDQYEIGDDGSRLSGGEKQRLTIARALYGDPSLLILDEATSSLDAASEKLVTESIGRAIKGRTAIIIAHRLSTIKLANKIWVIEDGRLVQEGSHELLSQEQGDYKKYFDLSLS